MLKAEIFELKQREHQGVWDPEQAYAKGAMVSRQGSTWLSTTSDDRGKPGESRAWTLIVKPAATERTPAHDRPQGRDDLERALAGCGLDSAQARRARLEFSVNERGLLDLVIGHDDLPNTTQEVTLAIIRAFKLEIAAALREEARGVEH